MTGGTDPGVRRDDERGERDDGKREAQDDTTFLVILRVLPKNPALRRGKGADGKPASPIFLGVASFSLRCKLARNKFILLQAGRFENE